MSGTNRGARPQYPTGYEHARRHLDDLDQPFDGGGADQGLPAAVPGDYIDIAEVLDDRELADFGKLVYWDFVDPEPGVNEDGTRAASGA